MTRLIAWLFGDEERDRRLALHYVLREEMDMHPVEREGYPVHRRPKPEAQPAAAGTGAYMRVFPR